MQFTETHVGLAAALKLIALRVGRRQSKVGNLHGVLAIGKLDQKVLRLEIAVGNTTLVHLCDALQHLIKYCLYDSVARRERVRLSRGRVGPVGSHADPLIHVHS